MLISRKLDETSVQLEAIQFTEFRMMAALSKGDSPGPESSVIKALSAEITQRITELTVEAMGEYASVHQPEARAVGSNVPTVGPSRALSPFRVISTCGPVLSPEGATKCSATSWPSWCWVCNGRFGVAGDGFSIFRGAIESLFRA